MISQRVAGFVSVVCCLVLANLALAVPPTWYYNTVDLSSQAALRQSLHNIIDDHTKIPYTASSTDTWDVLERADEDPYNSGRILDVYRNRTYTKQGGGNNYYNREHVWAKSFGFPNNTSGNKCYTDCHHLFLCDIGYNSNRDNNIFDDCQSSCSPRAADFYDGASGTNYLNESYGPVGIWEVWSGRRGDIARAMFYMDVRYEGDSGSEPDLILTDNVSLIDASATGSNLSVAYMGLLSVLLQWHEDDPVDDRERARNDAVYTYQGNRNPFIDHPEWVSGVFLGIISDVPEAAAEAGIAAVYPNPFNPQTTVAFDLDQAGSVDLGIYGPDGRCVRTLVTGSLAAGHHEASWNGRDDRGRRVASGTWFVRLRSAAGVATRKVQLIK